jgi:hypothetical protein
MCGRRAKHAAMTLTASLAIRLDNIRLNFDQKLERLQSGVSAFRQTVAAVLLLATNNTPFEHNYVVHWTSSFGLKYEPTSCATSSGSLILEKIAVRNSPESLKNRVPVDTTQARTARSIFNLHYLFQWNSTNNGVENERKSQV